MAALAVAFATLLVGCGGSDGGDHGEQDRTGPPTFIETTRAGSFLDTRGHLTLVLRGVGATTALGAEGSGQGGSAGAIATADLFRRRHELLGPDPLRATLAGAEVIPQRYDLELRNAHYDSFREELSFDARIVSGAPKPPPGSFGAATLTIASSLPGFELAGTVHERTAGPTGQEGGPLGGALIAVHVGRLGIATASSLGDGSFSLGPLPAGSYAVDASLDGYRRDSATRTLPSGTEPLDFQLVTTATSTAAAG